MKEQAVVASPLLVGARACAHLDRGIIDFCALGCLSTVLSLDPSAAQLGRDHRVIVRGLVYPLLSVADVESIFRLTISLTRASSFWRSFLA